MYWNSRVEIDTKDEISVVDVPQDNLDDVISDDKLATSMLLFDRIAIANAQQESHYFLRILTSALKCEALSNDNITRRLRDFELVSTSRLDPIIEEDEAKKMTINKTQN